MKEENIKIKRNERVHIRLTTNELNIYKKACEKTGLTYCELFRRLITRASLTPKFSPEELGLMMKVANVVSALKRLKNLIKKEDRAELISRLDAILVYLENIIKDDR